jgi:hypothetical protein
MDRAGVRKAVADIMADDKFDAMKAMLDSFEDNILQCKGLAELLEIARARVLSGMAAHVEKIPAHA